MDKEQVVNAFAKTVIELRKERGLSQEKLANLADIDRSNLSRIERGHYGPTLITLFQMSEALDLDIEELIRELKRRF